ncbi:hypothetical protein DPMN_024427 [Dreissena polymorpha]|uniref:Uncharacterized protein n=1 Tax=Dreissena polymorpha TaxID=45954 RepID=A0A9D4RCB0_DREPO|nr:hypothetical protein DPMN_024427 [Dreissena polymorpha]
MVVAPDLVRITGSVVVLKTDPTSETKRCCESALTFAFRGDWSLSGLAFAFRGDWPSSSVSTFGDCELFLCVIMS